MVCNKLHRLDGYEINYLGYYFFLGKWSNVPVLSLYWLSPIHHTTSYHCMFLVYVLTDGKSSSDKCKICIGTVMSRDLKWENRVDHFTHSLCLIACVKSPKQDTETTITTQWNWSSNQMMVSGGFLTHTHTDAYIYLDVSWKAMSRKESVIIVENIRGFILWGPLPRL